jgi:hypothetical protein
MLSQISVYFGESNNTKNIDRIYSTYNSLDDSIMDGIFSISRSTLAGHKKTSDGKERAQRDLVPIIFTTIQTSLGRPKPLTIRVYC